MERHMNPGQFLKSAAIMIAVGVCVVSVPCSAQEPKPRATIEAYTLGVSSLVFSPDGKTLVSGGVDESDTGVASLVKLWDVATGRNRAILDGADHQSGGTVAISPDGKTLASWQDGGKIHLWNISTGKITAKLDHSSDHSHPILVFSPDSKTLASGGMCVVGMCLWDAATGRNIFTREDDNITTDKAMAFMPDGKVLASMDDHGVIKLWDVPTGKNTATLKTAGAIDSAAFSPDGKTVATGGEIVKLWEVATGKEVASHKRHADACLARLAFSPDGKMLAGVDENKTIQLWDAANGKSRATFQEHADYVVIAFSPDGKTLASASEDKTIKLWDVPKLQSTSP